jgi:hypothetical protein
MLEILLKSKNYKYRLAWHKTQATTTKQKSQSSGNTIPKITKR